jgi:hypothetical protein
MKNKGKVTYKDFFFNEETVLVDAEDDLPSPEYIAAALRFRGSYPIAIEGIDNTTYIKTNSVIEASPSAIYTYSPQLSS